MSDPITTTGALASAASKLKDVPLWLLTAAALCLTVFLVVPDFRLLVAPTTVIVVEFGTVAAWIFAACRAVGPAIGAFQTYRTSAAARVRFVLTPIEGQCVWVAAKQKDGSILTQVSGHFLANNRTDERLYVMTARTPETEDLRKGVTRLCNNAGH